MGVFLSMSKKAYKEISKYLTNIKIEDAAFAYVKQKKTEGDLIFELFDWDQLNDNDYESRSKFHLILTNETKARVIKKAHDLDASLVELHSHSGSYPVRFSWSDFEGFKEFVPHVMWRLKGRPYLALVFNKISFDGFVWTEKNSNPKQLNGLLIDDKLIHPTNLSLNDYLVNDE